ncbi:MAG TPA: hypothetical protein DER01_00120, partial [Phycisphaerales bacterium]|nr:hypothetical protein [Phycisphaerales bacterium]
MNRQTQSILTVIGLIVLGVILWLLFSGKSDSPNTNITTQDQPTAVMPDTKLTFVPALLEIKRTYDQRGKVMLRNDGESPVSVRVDCDPPDDLNSGFIGRGSRDWFEPTALTMGVGETWAFDFVVHANATQRDTASIPVVARVMDSAGDWQVAAMGKVDVKIAIAPLKLNVQWEDGESPADQARLVKYLTITNMGVEIPNFTVNFTDQFADSGYPDMQDGPLFGKVLMDTFVERMHLQAGQSIKLRVWPRLSPSFIQLVGKIYLHGHNQMQIVDYEASVPEGQDVFVTVSRSTGVSGNSGDRCTNQGAASYALPPTGGTPATPPSNAGGYGGGGGGLSGSIGSSGGSLSGGLTDSGPADEEDEDEFAWGTPFGDVASASSSGTDKTKDTAGDETQAEESEDSELADQNLLDNSEALVEDLDEDAMIPASALGADLIPIDEVATTLGRTLDPNWGKKDELKPAHIPDELWEQFETLRDPQSATKETVVQAGKDGGVLVAKHNKRENTTALEFRNFGFGIQKGRKLNVGTPLVRNSYPVSQPTLGRTSSGKTVAAYSRPEGDKQIVTVQDVQTGKKVDIGVEGDQQATSPKIIRDPQSGKSFVQYVQDGQVKQSELGDDLTISKPQTIFAPQDKVQRILSSEPLRNGKQVTLAKTVNNKLLMKLPMQDKPVELDARDGSVLANADDSVYVALRTKDNAIVVKTSENDSHQIAPPDAGNGPPTLVRTAAGHPRVIYHRKLADSSAADAEQGGTFQADFIKGQWFPTKRAVQPEEPVTAAAVAVEFKPKYGKGHYKLMNTQIQLNGKTIGKLNERIPDGRYLY